MTKINPLIVIIICFLFSLIFGVVLLLPKFQYSGVILKSLKNKEAEIQYKEKYFSEINQISTELEKYQTELSKIDSALPFDPSLPSLLDFLQKASSQSGLVLKGISPIITAPSEVFTNLKETKFSIVVAGSYSSFKEFLLVLEKSARLIEVEDISFSFPEQKESFDFNLRIKVYNY